MFTQSMEYAYVKREYLESESITMVHACWRDGPDTLGARKPVWLTFSYTAHPISLGTRRPPTQTYFNGHFVKPYLGFMHSYVCPPYL